jgi:hypothetical protein
MFTQLLRAVRSDVDGQIGWAKNEIKRQTRHTALIGVLASAGALAALGAIVVGLVALHHWLALQFGPFAAYGTIGGSLLLLAGILFTFGAVRQRPQVASPPPLQIAQPVGFIGTLREGGYGDAISIGTRGLNAATTSLSNFDRKALLGTLAIAAVVGLAAGRRLS